MKKLSDSDTLILISKLITTFAEEEKLKKNHLIWNSLKYKPKIVTFEQAICLNEKNELFFYMERQKEMYTVKPVDVKLYFENLEPWSETDVYLFDITFSWLISFTHEDVILYLQILE